jgi:hypothetical protein
MHPVSVSLPKDSASPLTCCYHRDFFLLCLSFASTTAQAAPTPGIRCKAGTLLTCCLINCPLPQRAHYIDKAAIAIIDTKKPKANLYSACYHGIGTTHGRLWSWDATDSSESARQRSRTECHCWHTKLPRTQHFCRSFDTSSDLLSGAYSINHLSLFVHYHDFAQRSCRTAGLWSRYSSTISKSQHVATAG